MLFVLQFSYFCNKYQNVNNHFFINFRMKKIYFILLLVLSFASCKMGDRPNSKTLTVTIEPQRYFLEQIVGDKYEVNTLVPPGASPETYEPSPMAMINLGNSDAYFKVGFLGYENAWSGKLAKNNPNVLVVDCSQNIDLMYGTHGPHSHDDGDHDHDHDHDVLAADPHIWSSAKNALQFSKNMLDAMLVIDPDNKDYYMTNYEQLESKILKTDSLITDILVDISSRSFIIYHPALSYFARDYNLEQYSIEFEGKNPSPAQMKELVDLAKEEGISVVLIQQEFDVKNTEVIAKELGAKPHVINPLSYNWDDELLSLAKLFVIQE